MHINYRRLIGRRRRGIVLVLILAMLGLLALIGVTFATISNQAQIGARNYAQSLQEANPDQIIDFALSQLINDTELPTSALRGHSLKRDMYGNDGYNFGYLGQLPNNAGPLQVVSVVSTLPNGNIVINTNIPTGNIYPPLYELNCAGWILRMQLWVVDASTGFPKRQGVPPVTQTYEVVVDNRSGAYHQLTLSAPDPNSGSLSLVTPASTYAGPIYSGETTQILFELDGRHLRSFNGSGVSGAYNASAPAYPNFLFNGAFYGLTTPYNHLLNMPAGVTGAFGMDEDYDACDLENMFLALKSADGSVLIPSFHRPSLIVTTRPVTTRTTG